MNIETKQCSKCKESKLISEFGKQLNKIRASCKSCNNLYNNNRLKNEVKVEDKRRYEKKYRQSEKYKNNPNIRYCLAKATAKQRKRTFLISKEKYLELILLPCHYCDNKLGTTVGARGIGLDRIDNTKGYETDNVLPCCKICSRLRADQ